MHLRLYKEEESCGWRRLLHGEHLLEDLTDLQGAKERDGGVSPLRSCRLPPPPPHTHARARAHPMPNASHWGHAGSQPQAHHACTVLQHTLNMLLPGPRTPQNKTAPRPPCRRCQCQPGGPCAGGASSTAGSPGKHPPPPPRRGPRMLQWPWLHGAVQGGGGLQVSTGRRWWAVGAVGRSLRSVARPWACAAGGRQAHSPSCPCFNALVCVCSVMQSPNQQKESGAPRLPPPAGPPPPPPPRVSPARLVTMSPRMPSTFSSEQIWLIFTLKFMPRTHAPGDGRSGGRHAAG